jgi:putative ABC transport system ATP-binding protein
MSGKQTASQIPEENMTIQTQALWRVYKVDHQEVAALRGVDMQLESGRFIALKGRSGSGKTTLLNCLGGLDRPTSGTVRVLGLDLAQLDDEQLASWRRERLGLVFQSFSLLPTFSAYENIELMLRIQGQGIKERRERSLDCLEQVGLSKWIHHRPYELSGGQQQRVAIARSIANRPSLILADEPTGELDSSTAREILALFQRIVQDQGVTLLMVSHDALVDEYADQVLQLKDGQLGS